MKAIALSLMLTLSLASFAQNGGSSNESDALRIDWLGGKLQVKNKQSCNAQVFVTFGAKDTTFTMTAGALVVINAPSSAAITQIKAKPLSNCGAYSMGYVTIPISVLPIKFESVTYKWLNDHDLQVIFKVAEVSGINSYHIKASKDGVNWEDKTIVFPNTTQPNSTYIVNLKF